MGLVDRAPNVGDVARQFEAACGRAHGVQCDIADRSSVARMLVDVTAALGPVDVLVNAHGINPNVRLLEMDDAEWDDVFAINARGTMLTCQAVAKQMIARSAHGSIVNISSAAADSPRAGGAAYSGSKATCTSTST